MNVKVRIELRTSPKDVDTEEMQAAARALTNNEESVVVYVPDDVPNTIVAEFAINKARQMDVVDRIGRQFRNWVTNYGQSRISFPEGSSTRAGN
jgi:hypothetical protein